MPHFSIVSICQDCGEAVDDFCERNGKLHFGGGLSLAPRIFSPCLTLYYLQAASCVIRRWHFHPY